MKAVARRVQGYTHEVEVDGHTVVTDEPAEAGGADEGPSPTRLLTASLAACTATTVEMYADRKGWELGAVEVDVEFHPAPRGETSRFEVDISIPMPLSDEQLERIRTIAGKCPVHRALTQDVEIEDRVSSSAAS
ncbi:MAG TPA: OsmC family protein [Solirubrobacterales bacterium]|nr:OsmC family protein [Solirubrobacterales bacterium]